MNRGFRFIIRIIPGAIVNSLIVEWEHSFIHVLVTIDFDIHTVLVEKVLQSVGVQDGQSFANDALIVFAVVTVICAAVHGPMAHRHDPGPLFPILCFACLCQIFFQPAELVCNLCPAVLHEEVVFGREADEVDGTDVKAVKVVVDRPRPHVRHRKAGIVIGEVAVSIGKIIIIIDMSYGEINLLSLLVIPDNSLIRDISCNRFDLSHELVPHSCILL